MTRLLSPLQAGIDLSSSGPTPQQTALAVILLIAFFGALVLAGYLIQFVGLSEQQKREKKALIGQRENQDPAELRFEAGENPADRLDEVRALFDGEPPDVEHVTLRSALGAVREEFGDSWHGYASAIPRLARWLLELAVGLALTAAVVHVSAATWRRLFEAGGGPMTVDEIVSDALWAVEQTVTLAADTLGLFPFVDVLWALAFAYSVQAAQWTFDHPLAILALLVGTAGAVIWLDRKAPGARSVSVRSDRSDVLTIGASLAVVWAAGALPAAALAAIGVPQMGAVVGLLAALTVTGWLVYKALHGTVSRVRRAIALLDDESRSAIAYLVVRRAGVSVAAVAAILIPTYTLSALVTGKLGAVIGAYLTGSLEIQVATGLLVLCGVGLGVWAVRDALPNVRVALRTVMSKSAIRVAVFGRGAPFIVMTVVYFLAIGFALPWVLGLALALVAGIVTRLVYYGFRRVRYRVSEVDVPEFTPDMVQVQAYQLETVNGDERYYADVNTVAVAHDDPDALAREICAVADDLFAGAEIEPSIEQAFAEDLVRFGKVDREETRKSLMTDAKIHGEGWLEDNGGMMDATELDEQVTEHVPESIWTEWRDEQLNRGEWRRQNGYYLLSS